MTIRRLSAYLPLAAVVGAGIHVAAAGFAHAPGGDAALAFLGTIAATLAFALGATFVAGAVGTLRPSIATKRPRGYDLLVAGSLALAGTGVYAVVEALEGHLPLAGTLRALAASFPIAALVLAVSRRAARAAVRAGARFAATARAAIGAVPPLRAPARRRRSLARNRLLTASARGRAPPLPF